MSWSSNRTARTSTRSSCSGISRPRRSIRNVDSKIVQNDGRDVFIGEGFESDEEFKDWRFRRMKGRMEVEVKPTEQEVEVVPDSTAGMVDGASGPVPAQQSGKPPLHPPASLCPNPLSSLPSLRFQPGGPFAGCARQAGARRSLPARPRTEQQQMKPVDLKLDDDEIQSTQ